MHEIFKEPDSSTMRWLTRACGFIVGALACCCDLPMDVHAQAASDAAHPPAQELSYQELQRRVEQLETELGKLRALIGKSATPTDSSPSSEVDRNLSDARTRYPALNFHGFGDISYVINNEDSERNQFSIGQLDVFLTSRLADDFDVLSEIVFESDENNEYRVEVERLILRYTPNDYFNFGVGRVHTAIGFYNTAYHHGTWLQTAVGRPAILDFEDDGGALPLHLVGLSIDGRIPSGSLGLGYVLEVGNGRGYDHDKEPVLNMKDDNSYKAVNVGINARPDWMQGLQLGISGYFDRLTPEGQGRIQQTIVAGYAVYQQPKFEWLNEVLWLYHNPRAAAATRTWAAYTQISRQFGRFRPYVRYHYSYAPQADWIVSNFGQPGLVHGPSAGLRIDLSDLVAFKLQYDHDWRGNRSQLNQVTTQVSFTF